MFPVNEGASGRFFDTIAGGGSNQIPSAADASAGAEGNSANAASAATELGGTVLEP